MIIPLLREIFGDAKTELELKLIALQMICTMQISFLHEEQFRRYAGVDIGNPNVQEEIIDLIIDNNILQTGK